MKTEWTAAMSVAVRWRKRRKNCVGRGGEKRGKGWSRREREACMFECVVC